MKIKIKESKDNQFYFVIIASNGETLATSEMYTTKQSCKETAFSIKNSANLAEVHDVEGEILVS